MNFSVDRDALTEALRTLQHTVPNKVQLPILGTVRVEATEEMLLLTANNLDTCMSVCVSAKVKKPGVLCLPLRRLGAIIPACAASETTITVIKEATAQINNGGSSFRIMGMLPTDFPQVPVPKTEGGFTLKQSDLKRYLSRVSYARSADESRYFLNGVYFDVRADGKMVLVATDGRRLAISNVEGITVTSPGSFILPGKTVDEVLRLCSDDAEAMVRVIFSSQKVLFEFDTAKGHALKGVITYISKLVEGNYPNYKQVIPTGGDVVQGVMIDRELLASALSRVSLVTSDRANSVKFSLDGASLRLFAASPEVGEANEEIALEASFAKVDVSFNPLFLQQPIGALSADKIRIDLKDNVSPCVLRQGDEFLCVVMPVRI